MDNDMAVMIWERYQSVLAKTSQMISGVPESRLPCDQSLIKEAIKQVMSKTPKDAEAYMDLQTAYANLAVFIPDKQAERVAKAEAALMSMDMNAEGFQYLNEHADVQKKIQDDMYLLTQELNEFIRQQVD